MYKKKNIPHFSHTFFDSIFQPHFLKETIIFHFFVAVPIVLKDIFKNIATKCAAKIVKKIN